MSIANLYQAHNFTTLTYIDTEIKYTDYGQLWQIPEQVPHPALETLLTAEDHLIVLRHGQPPYKVVFGVPHQISVSGWRICERRMDKHGSIKSRKGDNNVASYALVAFSRLRDQNVPCKMVIMAHATTHDPNKIIGSPYCQAIFSQESKLLFECHACSSKRHLDLELSAGKNPLTPTIPFGRILGARLGYRYKLGLQSKAGKSEALILEPDGTEIEGELQLPATKTTSLTEAGERGLPALHLEAKPFLRIPKDLTNSVSAHGLILGIAIAETIIQFGDLNLI